MILNEGEEWFGCELDSHSRGLSVVVRSGRLCSRIKLFGFLVIPSRLSLFLYSFYLSIREKKEMKRDIFSPFAFSS